jgi:hypothetical protein
MPSFLANDLKRESAVCQKINHIQSASFTFYFAISLIRLTDEKFLFVYRALKFTFFFQ